MNLAIPVVHIVDDDEAFRPVLARLLVTKCGRLCPVSKGCG